VDAGCWGQGRGKRAREGMRGGIDQQKGKRKGEDPPTHSSIIQEVWKRKPAHRNRRRKKKTGEGHETKNLTRLTIPGFWTERGGKKNDCEENE